MREVSVTTGSRLHFGPLSVGAPAGGRFGGVGVMIAAPRTVLTARTAAVDRVCGEGPLVSRVDRLMQTVRQSQGLGDQPACELQITETIPAHAGFGSGTQLGLAVATAMSRVADESEISLKTLAMRVQRGRRSAIGLYGFQQGGFLVDGGRFEANQIGTLVTRVEFPSDWRFVLAAPKKGVGLSGEAEQSAFGKQPPMPVALTAELCRIVLMDWLPATIDADFDRCSEAMYTFGYAVGEFFLPAQGGVFASPRMAEWVETLQCRGLRGVAQTSWGPTVAALCDSEAKARQLQHDFANDENWTDCTFDVVEPLNRGATIQVS